MRILKMKIMPCLMATIMILVLCPFMTKAQESANYEVSNEQSLREAVNSVQDGDTISIISNIYLAESDNIVITKDITMDFGQSGSLRCENSDLDAVLIISDCNVTITGNYYRDYYLDSNNIDKAIIVKAESEDTFLNINCIKCSGTIATSVSTESLELRVTINNAEFKYDNERPIVDLNGGK